MLFHLGAVLIDSPGPFNAENVNEDFGADFAVKPIVGSRQDREFMGEADGHMTITGTLLPMFYERNGQANGLSSIDRLRDMTSSGKPQLLVRGDGRNLRYWYVEKVTLKSTKLATTGIGKVITYDIQLVRSLQEADPADAAETASLVMDSLVNLYE